MASDFWLIVGLGNPGKKYEGTRHNMGFMTADILAERWSVAFSDHKGLAMLGKGAMNLQGRNVKFFLAKPLTYMNDSGNAVASISAYYQIQPDHVVVIHDDMDLEFVRIKVKAGGSAGGHNGIKSIDKALSTPKYARVRMGVGHAQRGAHAHDNTVNWVLGGFRPDQRKQLPEFLADGADAPKPSSSTDSPPPRRSSMAAEQGRARQSVRRHGHTRPERADRRLPVRHPRTAR